MQDVETQIVIGWDPNAKQYVAIHVTDQQTIGKGKFPIEALRNLEAKLSNQAMVEVQIKQALGLEKTAPLTIELEYPSQPTSRLDEVDTEEIMHFVWEIASHRSKALFTGAQLANLYLLADDYGNVATTAGAIDPLIEIVDSDSEVSEKRRQICGLFPGLTFQQADVAMFCCFEVLKFQLNLRILKNKAATDGVVSTGQLVPLLEQLHGSSGLQNEAGQITGSKAALWVGEFHKRATAVTKALQMHPAALVYEMRRFGTERGRLEKTFKPGLLHAAGATYSKALEHLPEGQRKALKVWVLLNRHGIGKSEIARRLSTTDKAPGRMLRDVEKNLVEAKELISRMEAEFKGNRILFTPAFTEFTELARAAEKLKSLTPYPIF